MGVDIMPEAALTFQSVLGVVCLMYDPLGLVSPYILQFKILHKETHQIPDIKWDTPLSGDIERRWKEAILDLVLLEEIMMKRSVKPNGTADKLEIVEY